MGGPGARARQGGTVVETMPTLPASAWPDPPEGVPASALTWAEVIAPGGAASKVLARGTSLRLRDLHGQACAHLLLYSADQPWERLNVADTVKIPWQAYLGTGHPLLSDQGRVLATMIADDSGRHDALCGGGAPARARFVNLAAKHGLEPRDLPPSVSLFQGVRVQADGSLTWLGQRRRRMFGDASLRAAAPRAPRRRSPPHRSAARARGDGARGARLARAGDRARGPAVDCHPRASASVREHRRLLGGSGVIDEVVPACAPWSAVVPADGTLRIVDLEGNQAVDFLLYNAHDTAERYSAQDTIAAQGNIFLTTGSVLRSNEGRPLMTIVADDVRPPRHDRRRLLARSPTRCATATTPSTSTPASRTSSPRARSGAWASATSSRTSTGS